MKTNKPNLIENLFNGTCFTNFDHMPSTKQTDVILKVAAVAFSGVVFAGLMIKASGVLFGACLVAVPCITLLTFAYLTYDYNWGNAAVDFAKEKAEDVHHFLNPDSDSLSYKVNRQATTALNQANKIAKQAYEQVNPTQNTPRNRRNADFDQISNTVKKGIASDLNLNQKQKSEFEEGFDAVANSIKNGLNSLFDD